jgi:hypothetical protein
MAKKPQSMKILRFSKERLNPIAPLDMLLGLRIEKQRTACIFSERTGIHQGI